MPSRRNSSFLSGRFGVHATRGLDVFGRSVTTQKAIMFREKIERLVRGISDTSSGAQGQSGPIGNPERGLLRCQFVASFFSVDFVSVR